MQAVLPTEILALTLQQLERKDIPSVLRANGTFYDIAVPILYRSIHYLPVARSIACLKILKHNPALTMLVYDLSIDWSDYQITGNLLRLLRSVLQQLKHLRSLSLELSLIDNHGTHAWVFENAPYSLHTFTTSSRCDDVLASVLERQPHIVDLSLCGYQTNVPFTLSPSALPRLESLRCTHAGAAVVAEVVRGRPVGTMSISLYADEGFGALDTLLLVKSSLRRLTLMALDDLSATSVLNEVAARVPQLQALHIVVLLSQYTYESLMEAGPALSNFKELRYITVMGGMGADVTDDHSIAKEWHKHCKTLKTIILPKGQVWFERNGEWGCCLHFKAPDFPTIVA